MLGTYSFLYIILLILFTHLLVKSRRDLSPAYKFNICDGLDVDGDLNQEKIRKKVMEVNGHDVSYSNSERIFESSLRKYEPGTHLLLNMYSLTHSLTRSRCIRW